VPLSASRFHRTLALCALAALLLPLTASAQKTTVFPTTTAYNLNKERITLPADFDGNRNLLLISFASEQAPMVSTWEAVGQALEHTEPHFRTYRMPVAPVENMLYRWWGNAALRGAETDPEMWRWTVPLYLDTASFRAALGIADARSNVTLLVDKAGRVLWRATGAATPELRAALMAAAAK
jgi:hypothetical protein